MAKEEGNGYTLLIEVIIASLGVAICIPALVYLLYAGRFRKTHEITSFHLIFTDLILCIGQLLLVVVQNKDTLIIIVITMIFIKFTSLLPVAVDRLMAVLRPFHYGKDPHIRQTYGILILCWVIPIATMAIILAFKIRDEFTFWLAVIAFMATPSTLNIISFTVIFHRVKTKTGSCITCTLVKSVLINIIFILSWLTPLIMLVKDNLMGFIRVYFCLFFSALTDPILYLIPNPVIVRCMDRVQARVLMTEIGEDTAGHNEVNNKSIVKLESNGTIAIEMKSNAAPKE